MKNITKSWQKDEIDNVFKKSNPLSSGSENLDSILDGGFYPGIVYVIYGEFNTGKTQICHQLSTNMFLKSNELNVKNKQNLTLFIDAENTFRPERIRQIASALKLKPDSVLNSIDHSKIIGSTALNVLFNKLENIIKETNYKLLLIDSITNHYRAEQFEDEKKPFKLKTQFLKVLQILNQITRKHNLITIVTSQVSPTFSDESFFPVKPVALTLLNHFFSEFIYLGLSEENKRVAHIVNSEFYPERRSLFTITEDGIRDYKLISKT